MSSTFFLLGSMACIVFLNVFAVFLLLRGHNLPGGGFIAGAASAVSLIILSMNYGADRVRKSLGFDPIAMATSGLTMSFCVACAPMLAGRRFLEHFHLSTMALPVVGKFELGTPLLFEVGIYLIVVGIISRIVFAMLSSNSGMSPFTAEEMRRFSHTQEIPVVHGDPLPENSIGIGSQDESESKEEVVP